MHACANVKSTYTTRQALNVSDSVKVDIEPSHAIVVSTISQVKDEC